MASLVLPKEYAAVLGVFALTPGLLLWQGYKVGSARKAAGVPYPFVFADAESEWMKKNPTAAARFNCAQRAHGNTLEMVPIVMPSLLVAGLRFPLVAAGLGLTFLVGRVVYSLGYQTGDPKKRVGGMYMVASLAGLGLVLSNFFVAADAVRLAFF